MWRMSAIEHRSVVRAFRQDIIKHVQSGTAFPVGEIVDLLPIQTDQADDLRARGDFVITGGQFVNAAAQSLDVTINDPAMGMYTLTIPKKWAGTATINGEEVTLKFDGGIKAEIPRLRDLGVRRSEFQTFVEIQCDAKLSTSRFVDTVDTNLVTLVEVTVGSATVSKRDYKTAGNLVVFDSSVQCASGDPGAQDWYVIVRKNDGLCFVHEGTVVEGGMVAYDTRFGPSTEAACDDYENQHCPNGYWEG